MISSNDVMTLGFSCKRQAGLLSEDVVCVGSGLPTDFFADAGTVSRRHGGACSISTRNKNGYSIG